MQRLYVVMGVAGSGKSSIGAGVANAVGGTYLDGDDFHPKTNIDKMSRGEPLSDSDRWPWLEIVADELSNIDGIGFIGCSALKKSYRDFITQKAGEAVQFIYLDGTKKLIVERMAARRGHFMPTLLLDSQFETLEVPDPTENHIKIDISGTSDDVISLVVAAIENQKGIENGK